MIELCQYHSLRDKNRFLEQLDLSHSTLVVSDLSSKFYWQNFLIEKNGFVSGPQILRAEDLWKTLIQRSYPEKEIVSGAWMTSYLKKTLTTELASQFGLPYARPATALRAINELLPILCHPESLEVMENWFDEANKSQCSWKNWFYLAETLWTDLNKKNLILSEWSSAVLLQQAGFEDFWKRDLIIDLGPEIRTVEAELLQTLSLRNKIQILMPKPSWLGQFQWISYPYDQFRQRSHSITKIPPQEHQLGKKHFKRFAAPLAEVKFAIGQIRLWLNQGYALHQMAILAPDIEEYWPTLRWHLKKENLTFEKSESIKLGTLGTVVAWMAYLKKQCGERLKASELELAEFHPLNHAEAKFTTHQSLWTKRPIPTNPQNLMAQSSINSQDFIVWATEVWPQAAALPEQIIELCKKWLMEAQRLEARSLRDWIEYLEDFLNHQECNLSSASEQSIGLYSLMSGLPSHKNLQIFLGCSESQLKSPSGFVKGAEVLSLQHHTGHLLAHPDRDFREYQLNLLLGEGLEQFFTFAESDFKGTELVPSIFWLNGREKTQSSLQELDSWPLSSWEREQLVGSLPEDTSNEERLHANWDFTLSPASMQTYVGCPFRFFAEKGLKLVDPAIVDLDLDARTQGSLQHRLLELLTQEPFDPPNLREKITEIVDQALESQSEMFFSPETKTLTRTQLLQLGLRFIDHEEIYRKEFPRFYTLAREAWFKRELNIDGRKVVFRGKIDRIDISSDHSEAIVLDYKSDITRYRNSGSWIQNLEYQLPAYAESVEAGSAETENKTKIPPTPVVAAHYYSLKDFARKGFTLAEASSGVVVVPTSKSKISNDEKISLLKEFHDILESSMKKIIEGDFRAIPHPITECKKCPWRNICRTQHPNL